MQKTRSSSRREFLAVTSTVLAATVPSLAAEEPTIGQVIERIIGQCAGKPLAQTVDTLKTGDPSWKVKGISTTFMATREVIEKTVQRGFNFIITHEPTFWNHTDDTSWLAQNPVYLSKRRLAEDNKIAIWRCHDYWHTLKPDPVVAGLAKALGWEKYMDPEGRGICTIPPASLQELAAHFKEKLGLQAVPAVGRKDLACRRVALIVGASPGRPQINLLSRPDIDALVVGDINEWEGCEFARDAVQAGMGKGFLVLGHAPSEDPGMKYLAEWLSPQLPGVPIVHIPANSPFHFFL